MKKFIFMLTAFMCVCTSCGDKSNNSRDDSESREPATFVTEQITQVPEVISEKDKGYSEIISRYKECMENDNVGNMMQLSYPDKYFEVFSFMAELSGMTVGEIMGTMQTYAENTIRIKEIISDEPLEDTEGLLNELVGIYGDYQIISDYIDEQGGMDKVDSEKFNEFLDSAEYDSENISLYFEPEDAHVLKCSMESSVKSAEDGTETVIDTYEQEFIVYYIDGEGWKMDTYFTEE